MAGVLYMRQLGAGELRLKESDRLALLAANLMFEMLCSFPGCQRR